MKYGRRGFAALLALVLAAGSGLPVSAAEVKVTSDQTKVASGSDITLTLTLDEAVDDVICFDYRVCFDEDSFSLKKDFLKWRLRCLEKVRRKERETILCRAVYIRGIFTDFLSLRSCINSF